MCSDKQQLESRAKGCLLGQAVGDALGTRYEFCPAFTVKSQIEIDRNRNSSGFLSILGMGPFSLTPGQVTDDTELAMGLARSLQNCQTYDCDDVAAAYHSWYQSGPFDIGTTTRAAFAVSGISAGMSGIKKVTEKKKCRKKIQKNAKRHNQHSLSNGCLMRISPLGIAGTKWKPEVLRETAKKDCQLTNPNPISQDAVASYISAIQTAILTGNATEAYESAVKSSQTKTVQDLLEAAKVQAVPVKVGQEMVNGDSEKMGYFGVAFQGAFYELLHTKDFETSLVDRVLRGGDTGTNGCIAGASLGAICGHDKIPEEWRKTVMEAKPNRLHEYPEVDMCDAKQLAVSLLDCTPPGK